MSRIKIVFSYDGASFSGYQVQPNKRTVQLELERALKKMHKGTPIKVISSGRTDAGVHAIGQVCHFDSALNIASEAWKKALNALLPNDIHVHSAEEVEATFHARFDTTGKEYRYKLLTSKDPNVFQRHYMYHYPYHLNKNDMKEAAKYFIGTHDFTSFCAANTDVKDKVRTIYSIDIIEEGHELVLVFNGNGFLYNMVRILVGTLLEVGNGKIKVSEIPDIIAAKNRAKAGKTAPSQGLYLWEVFYN
jgi:tRNA pseudouridine38-40 synthase